ncbi:MAG: radical SAM family heme chaperone HemW [Candidatus Marinimicrobia bacterium]|nr:radical SAM family heme chaperone HemW [Candidatus Neomarinimicrobiota bacterium]MCF7839175.1 radical SAM family heme chaperone HemW [Candidatus Neomarinimicrobiota bacterium]
MNNEIKTPLSLYFHIPFCKVKCVYCDFYSIPKREETIPAFVGAILAEFNQKCESLDLSNYFLDTIFIGGGTPSLLSPNQVETLLNAIQKRFAISDSMEITLEANPGEAPFEKLKAFRNLGVNRLSMGVQSLQPELLKFMSRIHSPEQSHETFMAARKAGFENINTDLIFAIPGQSKSQWLSDLSAVMAWGPEHISAYSLTVEEGTALHRWVKHRTVEMLPEIDDVGMYLDGREMLAANGYLPYEISNYSRSGFECRHNLNYWTQIAYLSFGPSAHSYFGNQRWWNVRSLDGYLLRQTKGLSAMEGDETLTGDQLISEYIFTRLRLNEGISPGDYEQRFGEPFELRHGKRMEKWLKKHIYFQDGHYCLTDAGLLLADDIAADLMV